MSRAAALSMFFRLARLPTLPPPVAEPGFDGAADALLRGEDVDLPAARLAFLRWLGPARGVVFHGSQRDDLDELVAEQGPLDTAHLVSHVPVRPLARIAVTPEDFPFRDRIGYYRDREPVWISLLRA